MSAVLARNEADRDLPAVLTRLREFSDVTILLDDRSTDSTAKIAKDLGCEVRGRSILRENAWGAEAPARAELWSWGAEVAGDGWLLVADADMILHGDPRPLTETWEVTAWCFILRDLWSETEFRVDGPWAAGPQYARPWMFRPSALTEPPQWSGRALHTGHCPLNFPIVAGIAPPDTYWFEHRAYITPERRKAKFAQYESQKDKLSPGEWMHAASIVE